MVLEAVASFVVALMKHTYNSGTKIIEHVWKRRRPLPWIITSGFEWSIKQPQLQTCISATSHLSLVSWGPLIGHSLFMTFVRLPAWSSFIIRHLISFILQGCLLQCPLFQFFLVSLSSSYFFWTVPHEIFRCQMQNQITKYLGISYLFGVACCQFVCMGCWYGICVLGFILKIVVNNELVKYTKKKKHFEVVNCLVS